MPRWSSASSTSIARCPWRSRPTSSSRAPSGHLSRHEPASTSASKRSSVARASPTSRWAATRAARSTSPGSAPRSAARRHLDLPVDDHQPLTHPLLVPELVARHVAPCAVGDPGDAAGGGGDVGHQHVGRRRTEAGGDGVLVLEPQHVARPLLLPVQGDADVDQRAVAAIEHGEILGRHDEVGVGGPPQRVHVAQPAVAVLEVGLQQERDIAGLAPPFDDLGAQRVEPTPAVAAPPGAPLRHQPRPELVVARKRPGAQQRRRRVEVVGGQRQLVVERSDGVTELEPSVPQGVPQLLGQVVEAARLPVVEQQHVDVAARRQLLTAVSADGDEGHSGPATPGDDPPDTVLEQGDEQLVGRIRQRPAELPATEGGVGDDPVASRGCRRDHPCRVRDRYSPYRGEVPTHLSLRRAVRGAVGLGAVGIAAVSSCTDDGTTTPTSPPPTVTTTTAPARPADGVLRIGLLLPESGEGATIGQPLIDAARLAVEQINAAGGVLGRPVELETFDEGNNATTAREAIASLLERDVDAVVGPASSTVALATLDDLLSNGKLTCSPTATSLALDEFPSRELFFRTAPSDSLQAAAIAEHAERTGARTAAVTYLDDAYGRPMAVDTIDALQARGLALLDPEGTGFARRRQPHRRGDDHQ